MEIVIGNFSGNVEACLEMGKDAFIEAHSQLADPLAVWKEIEKQGKKPTKEKA